MTNSEMLFKSKIYRGMCFEIVAYKEEMWQKNTLDDGTITINTVRYKHFPNIIHAIDMKENVEFENYKKKLLANIYDSLEYFLKSRFHSRSKCSLPKVCYST